MTSADDRVGLLLIHGAGNGAWVWDDVRSALAAPNLAVDLPNRGEPLEVRKGMGLSDYTEAVLHQAAALDAHKVIVVGHSLGGVIGLQVAKRLGGRLAGFVGVAAAIPRNGGSFISALPIPQRWVMKAVVNLVGTKPPDAAIKKSMCNDLDDARAAEVVARFTPEAKRVYLDRTDVQLPLAVPTLYVRTMNDAEYGAAVLDTMAANLGVTTSVEIDSGHMPMLAKPRELARILNDFTGSC